MTLFVASPVYLCKKAFDQNTTSKKANTPGRAAYELTIQGIACGLISYTILYMLLPETILEEVFHKDENKEASKDDKNEVDGEDIEE